MTQQQLKRRKLAAQIARDILRAPTIIVYWAENGKQCELSAVIEKRLAKWTLFRGSRK